MDTQNRIDHKTLLEDDYIEVWISAFLVAKKSENLVKGSIDFYQKRLKVFTNFLDGQEAKFINQITPNLIRDFLLFLEEKGHNSGGVHGYFRTIKTFLRWYWEEAEPDGKNPINKVKTPRNPEKPIQGITRDEFDTLLSLCSKNNFMGERDRTILMVLMDTGVRADELCNIQLEDINLIENSILIKQGKVRKPRFVFIGKRTRKQIRKYLKFRGTEGTYLFINRSEEKLVYNALRQILRRLGPKAGIKGISPHDFRRGFCLECLRKGMDLLTLSRIMGHTSLQLLSRYVKQSTVDLGNKYKSVIDD